MLILTHEDKGYVESFLKYSTFRSARHLFRKDRDRATEIQTCLLERFKTALLAKLMRETFCLRFSFDGGSLGIKGTRHQHRSGRAVFCTVRIGHGVDLLTTCNPVHNAAGIPANH